MINFIGENLDLIVEINKNMFWLAILGLMFFGLWEVIEDPEND